MSYAFELMLITNVWSLAAMCVGHAWAGKFFLRHRESNFVRQFYEHLTRSSLICVKSLFICPIFNVQLIFKACSLACSWKNCLQTKVWPKSCFTFWQQFCKSFLFFLTLNFNKRFISASLFHVTFCCGFPSFCCIFE